MLIEALKRDEGRIARTGADAIAAARAAGVPAYYVDRSIGEGIIKLMPDGTMHLIDADSEDDVILRTIMPGRCSIRPFSNAGSSAGPTDRENPRSTRIHGNCRDPASSSMPISSLAESRRIDPSLSVGLRDAG